MSDGSTAMTRVTDVQRWNGGDGRTEKDFLAIEEPLEIRVNDRSIAVTMRTPGRDAELAAGFLATERIIRSREDIYDITRCAHPGNPEVRNIVNVYVPRERVPEGLHAIRQRYANSSCGLCGKATIEEACKVSEPLEPTVVLSRAVLEQLPGKMLESQAAFAKTGGLHAAALFSPEGELICLAEDIGRHNAVDKVVGKALLSGSWPIGDSVLLVSGRAGFEIVQKGLAARIPAVCAVSAPSQLAVELARQTGMILAGFVREKSMNIYAGAERVAG